MSLRFSGRKVKTRTFSAQGHFREFGAPVTDGANRGNNKRGSSVLRDERI